MSRNDGGGKNRKGKGVREAHADPSPHRDNVISLRDWIEAEKETLIEDAADEDNAEEEYDALGEAGDDAPDGEIRLFDEDSDEPLGDEDYEEDYDGDDGGDDGGKPRKKKRAKRKEREPLTPEEEAKRAAARKKAGKVVGLAMFLVLLISGAALAYFLLIVDSIEISGLETYTEEEILEASGLSVDRHIWLNDIGDASRRILSDPYIKEAKITRVYPDKITIEITERHEAAVIIGMNSHAVIDIEGYVLWIGQRADYEGLVKVYGTGSSGYHVNQRLGEESNFHSRTLVTLLAAMTETGTMGVIESLDISNPLSIYMNTYDGLKIQIGQPDNAVEKLEKMNSVLGEVKRLGLSESGTLDVSVKGNPVYSPPNAPSLTIIGDSQATGGTPAATDDSGNTTPGNLDGADPTAPDPSPSPTPTQGGAQPSPSPTRAATGEPGFSG